MQLSIPFLVLSTKNATKVYQTIWGEMTMSEFSVQIDVSNALENKRHEEIDKKHTSIAVITVLTLLECRKVG